MADALSNAMYALLDGAAFALPEARAIHAWRILSYEPDVPLTPAQQQEVDAALSEAFSLVGVCAARFSEDGDRVTILLAHTAFPAQLHRDTALWLCCSHFNELCSLSLEQEGTLLLGMSFDEPEQWTAHLTPLYDVSEWWSRVAPTDGPTAHKHRAALQTIVKRRQYPAIAGYATRALRTEVNPAPMCFGFIPLVIEAVWSMHAELSYAQLTAGLDLTEMAPRPREALQAWLTQLAAMLRACPVAPESAPIERVIAAIRADCSLPYTQANLSRSLGLTPAYFCRLFREKTGQHFSSFLTITRMQRAEELLRQGGLSLQELSERCGYPNKSYFCQVFKKYTGMTPGEYEQHVLISRIHHA